MYPVGANTVGVAKTYYQWASQFGNVRILSIHGEIVPDLDLVILPGGPDVNPMRYGEIPDLNTQKPCILREAFDVYHLPEYIELGVPIFGICRGHQALAVHMGLNLIQHMYHPTNPELDRQKLVHEVAGHDLQNDSVHFSVNSIHHQVVSDEYLENVEAEVLLRFRPTKKQLFDPHIEAMYYPSINSAGVQWHPEEIYDEFSRNLVITLMENKHKNKEGDRTRDAVLRRVE